MIIVSRTHVDLNQIRLQISAYTKLLLFDLLHHVFLDWSGYIFTLAAILLCLSQYYIGRLTGDEIQNLIEAIYGILPGRLRILAMYSTLLTVW